MKQDRNLESLLPAFSVGRPITVLVLAITALVVGLVATAGIPLETFPQGYTPSFLTVVVPWEDAPPQEVLDKIVVPLEDELATVGGLERMSSLANSNRGLVFLSFKQGTDMDVAYREVRDRVERVRQALPEDADKVFIRKQDLADFPVYMVGLAIDPRLTDPYHLLQNEVVLPLERVEGVASITAHGLERKEILIEVDRQRAEASGLNIYRLGQELAGDNFTLASGSVRSGDDKLLLRSVAKYQDLAALENRMVGPSVRLKDVAAVEYEVPEQDYVARVDGQPAVALMVMKEGQANTLEVCRRVDAVIAELATNPRLQDIRVVPIFSQGEIILSSLGSLLGSGRIGALLAVAILFVFLRRFRMTLIITLSIPLSLMIALTAMFFAGETLNIITMLGLMISTGMLVDNSVVVAENVHRLHQEGLSRREACIKGAGEISLAVVMATLTTVAVFLPVSLVDGQAQFFLQRLSIPISASLLASLVVALVFVPLAVYLTLPRAGSESATAEPRLWHRLHRRLDGVVETLYAGSLGRLERTYDRLLAVALRRRLYVVVVLTLAMVATVAIAFKNVELAAQQENERAGFELNATLPASTSLAEAKRYFEAVERVIEGHREDWDLKGYFIGHRRSRGEIQGWFASPRTNELTARQVTDQLLAALPEVPGVKLFTAEQSRISECDEDEVHCLLLYAEDAAELDRVRVSLEDLFRGVEGVVGVRKSEEENPPELALVVDRDRAQRQGVNPQVVAGVVSYALRGQALPKFYRDGREVPVRVRFREENRESLAELADFAVPVDRGGEVPLSTVTDARFLPAAASIFRRDRQVSRTIALELEEGAEKATRERIRRLAGSIDLPEGMRFGSPTPSTDAEDVEALGLAALLSIVFVYLLMTFLFESFVLPLSVVVTIPLASIGVGWIHFLAGLNLDFLGGVAAVLLIGVVVNNGIVLIDAVNRLRADGHERSAALLLAAEQRFRPIMMTALTTIFGTVPLAFGGPTEIGISYTSFGLTLIGGMTTATFLTLLVVPVFYTLFDDGRARLASALRPAAPTPAVET